MICECGRPHHYVVPDDYLCFACGYELRGKHSAEGFEAMGLPISSLRRANAVHWAQTIISNPQAQPVTSCVNRVADRLEQDDPAQAMQIAMQVFDLTGSYRLFAYLLAS